MTGILISAAVSGSVGGLIGYLLAQLLRGVIRRRRQPKAGIRPLDCTEEG
jgi:membrane protein YqaA with SNARE-associated domain